MSATATPSSGHVSRRRLRVRGAKPSERSVRLFEHGALELCTRTHPSVPFLLWAPVAAWLLWRSIAMEGAKTGRVALLVMAALVVWSFTEYAIHRWVLHLAPKSHAGRRLVFVVHGVHHASPDDPTRLLMPPVPAALALAMLYGLFRLALGPVWVESFFAGFLAGYLAYDYTHFAIHRTTRTRLGRYLRRRHMIHHFVSPDARWGVTSPFWDWIFGTMGDRARRPAHQRS